MAEYIEREAILKDYQTICNGVECVRCPIRDKGHCKFEAYIRSIPAADVRPVVFCKDCKHNKGAKVWRLLDLDDVTADCSAGHGCPPMDWFCADGEKREES